MKIEIEIPDLEEIYYDCYEYEDKEITGKDLKRIIVDAAINHFVGELYNNYMNGRVYDSIREDAKEIVKVHSKEIVDRVVDKVSEEILRKKSIVNEMPKKSEIANISKEWEKYFIELIDKAIAKRFK